MRPIEVLSIAAKERDVTPTATTATMASPQPCDASKPNSSTAAASVGQPVQKYGRTTSLTTGQVTGINATVLVGYLRGTALFVNQIVVSSCPTTCIGAGDSGSLLVTNDVNLDPVGLLFAGNSSGSTAIANPIGAVLNYFSVAVDGR